MMLQTPLFFFLGILIIALYAVERFNTPPSNRASTTAARYYSAALAYVLIYLIFYYLLTKYPHLLKLVLKAVGDVPPPDWAKDGSSTIIVALLLSILISKTPVLSRADTRLRKFLQNLAAIPFEALRLSKEIHDAPFSVPETLHGKIKDHLIRRGFEEEDVVFGNGKHSGHLWTKNAALMLKLELWEQDARFAAFMYERRGQLSRLRERYERLSGMARNCLSLIRHPTSGDNKDPMHQAITKFCSSFADQTDDLFEEICRFISQGVLKCKLTQGARRRELEDTGFKPPAVEATRALSIDQVLTLWGILLGFSLVNFILITQAWKAPGKVLLMTTMIVTIYSIAVICAVYPKERWALFRK
ncbi:MAG: hypothetical protein GTO24_16050, partial [candidate division Zixibacteria bacterium]|nr:hypothetical protein [candidate division Zixibacteria bacterium]